MCPASPTLDQPVPVQPPPIGAERPENQGLYVEKAGTRVCLYAPLPHQQRFHESTARYCLMSGGRGSGKSKAMRFDAYMRCLMIPGFRALLVRRSMPELRDSHLQHVAREAAQMGLSKDAWHETTATLRFPNGSTLRFGHVEDDNALSKFLSSEFEMVIFDELATFSHRQFTFLCSSLRSPIPGYKPVARAGTNPVGQGSGWVKALFITKDPDPKRFPRYHPDDYEVIQANMDANPYIDREGYEEFLGDLPSDALRRALRHGEWVVEGQAFSEWREALDDGSPWHVIETMPTYHGRPIQTAPHIEIVRVIDWGYAPSGNPGICQWYACLEDGSAIGFQEYVFQETLPADAAATILEMSLGLRVRYTVGDTAMWQEHEGPSIAEHFAGAGVGMVEADKQRIPGWITLHTWLRDVVDNGTGRKRPRLSYLRSGCPHTIRTIPQQVVDPDNPGDIETRGVEDDAADCARYFTMSRPGRSHTAAISSPTQWIRDDIAKRQRRAWRLSREATRSVW